MANQISDPSVVVNNVAVAIAPNSLEFSEGFGEQEILVQSAGGGALQQVYSDNVETSLGMVKFSMRSTVENINLVRSWKANRNRNAVTVTATNDDGTFTRTFANAAIVSDYTVALSSDGVVEIEFKSDRPTI